MLIKIRLHRSTYLVRLYVDGHEAEPGYVKKLRPEDETRFKGFVCEGRDVHEFLFSRTPVDEGASSSAASAAAASSGLGEVRAVIFATRRVRVESSDDESDLPPRRSSAALGARALPEKQAVKELGVQSRAGGAIERVPSCHRRRGEYYYEKVKPEVAELRLLYRDDFWFERHAQPAAPPQAAPQARSGGQRGATTSGVAPPTDAGSRSSAAGGSAASGSAASGSAASAGGGAASAARSEGDEAKWWGQPPRGGPEGELPRGGLESDGASGRASAEGAASRGSSGARPMPKRAPGETGRGPDGKRRRKDGGEPAAVEAEVIELSD